MRECLERHSLFLYSTSGVQRRNAEIPSPLNTEGVDMFKRALASLIVALVLLIGSSAVEAEHGLAIDGNLKYH